MLFYLFFPCDKSSEKILVNRWYFKGMTDLETEEKHLIIQRCMYMELKADHTYIDQANPNGSWNLEGDSLILFLSSKEAMRCKIVEVSSDHLILNTRLDHRQIRLELVQRPDLCD